MECSGVKTYPCIEVVAKVDVSKPHSAVIPTLDGPVREVLDRTTRPLTGREVHRLAAAGSEAGVRRTLNRLVEHGLATAMQAGKATLYLANRAHLAWPAVDVLVSLRKELLNRLRNLIESWAAKPKTAAVFGSTAHGDGSTDSDIDILLIRSETTDPVAWEAQVDDMRDQVVSWTGNACQVYDLTEAEYFQHVAAGEPTVDEWQTDAVVVFGTPLARLDQRGIA